ncbi:hypothetical protein [Serinicoccus marinus]|uniref:hypothetical protein n=1 Tax=Serinicoccus marinus TaxID=247333 RepID=UPI0013760904|nr:hypothetical protein [Serinicoccus marinus]
MSVPRWPSDPADVTAPAPVDADPGRLLRAAEEISGLAPDLGWAEASGLTEGVLDAVSHLLADAASGRDTPRPSRSSSAPSVPPTASRTTPAAGLPRHGSEPTPPPWATTRSPGSPPRAGVLDEVAALLDQVADRTRRGVLGPGDKGVVLRRLHRCQRRLRAALPAP